MKARYLTHSRVPKETKDQVFLKGQNPIPVRQNLKQEVSKSSFIMSSEGLWPFSKNKNRFEDSVEKSNDHRFRRSAWL